MTIPALTVVRRFTSCSIMARERAANTPGPVITRRAPALSGPASPSAFSNAAVMAAMASACASMSDPAARVRASRMARLPSGEAHAPSTSCGPPSGRSMSRTASSSPVGSRGTSALARRPAGEASRSSVSPTADLRPATLKRSGVTFGLSR